MAMMTTAIVVVERSQEFLGRALGDQRRVAAQLGREMEERRRLEREIAGIGDDDRRRLGQEVHDGVCQELTGALLRCQALDRRVQQGGAANHSDLATLTRLLEEALNDAHAVARGLWPLDPDPGALAPALRSLVRRMAAQTGVSCEFRPFGDVRVCRPEVAQHLYRIAQEALSNAARHAQASHIMLDLVGCDDRLLLRVEDDGVGMPDDGARPGMGLRTMSYRARIMDGELTVERLGERGTRVACNVPRPSSDNDGGSEPLSDPARGEPCGN
jgi:signal transduction histidine kinase